MSPVIRPWSPAPRPLPHHFCSLPPGWPGTPTTASLVFQKHGRLLQLQAVAPGCLICDFPVLVQMLTSQKGFPRPPAQSGCCLSIPYSPSQHPALFSWHHSPWSIWGFLLSGSPHLQQDAAQSCWEGGNNQRLPPPSSVHKIVIGKRDVPNELNDIRGRQWIISSRAKLYGTLALKLGCILESSGGFKKYWWLGPTPTHWCHESGVKRGHWDFQIAQLTVICSEVWEHCFFKWKHYLYKEVSTQIIGMQLN